MSTKDMTAQSDKAASAEENASAEKRESRSKILSFFSALKHWLHPYRPEKHYMRGDHE